MWEAESEELEGGARRLRFVEGGAPLSFRALFARLESDPDFSTWYTGVLTGFEHPAFFWEHPPLTADRFDAPSELVLLPGRILSLRRPDPEAFRKEFQAQREAVIVFENLGHDALLIVPRPIASESAYGHLASFLRHGPADQVRALWARTGLEVRKSVGEEPRWVSTAGMGVTWLHVRIDRRPKYYRHEPYKAL